MVFTVKLPAAAGGGRPRACPRSRGDDLRRGGAGAGGVPRAGPQEPSPPVSARRSDGVRLRPPRGRGSVGGLRHLGAAAAGPHRRPARKDGCLMTSAAIYARVSSARQKKDQTIGSQTAALREHAAQNRLDVPEEWVFETRATPGHAGPARLEALRTWPPRAAWTWCSCYSPDRLARKFAYQALLIEEFARAGVRVEFVERPARRQPRRPAAGPVPGHVRRVREGPAHRTLPARQGPPRPHRLGERALAAPRSATATSAKPTCPGPSTRSSSTRQRWSPSVPPLHRRGASIADLARWLTGQGVHPTGKHRWDRSVIWAMLRNPAYAGTRRLRQDHGRHTSLPG